MNLILIDIFYKNKLNKIYFIIICFNGDEMFFYDDNLLHIGNYQSITYVEKELIILKLKKCILQIHGKDLLITQMNDSELFIQGIIGEIDIKNG